MTRRRLPGLGIVLLGFSLGAVAFLAGVWVGYVKPDYTLLDPLSEKAGLILKLPPALRPLGIFINNLLAATLTYVLTILLILPGLSVVGLNGYIVGTALKYAVDVKDLNLTVALLLIIPHGVLEIPAFLASVGFGMRCLIYCRGLRQTVENTLAMYAVTVPMLLAAAVIEIFITPAIAGVGGLGG